MNQQEALQILVQVAYKAQKAGVLELEEAPLVLNAINAFKKEPVKVDDNPSEDKQEQ